MKRLIHLLCFTIFLFSTLAYSYNLPDLGSPTTLTTTQEKKLGREFMMMLRQHVPFFDDPLANAYLRALGYRLISYSQVRGKSFHFFIINTGMINAFTAPDNNMGIDSGLIVATQNESELAAVLAHEISHATQQHLARGMAEAKRQSWITLGTILAAIAIGSQSGNGEAAVGAATAAAAGGLAQQLSYSRAFEQEADRLGMDMLHEAGFNPYGMPSFFRQMERLTLSYGDQVTAFLSTHPVTRDRIADSENRAAQYKPRNYSSSEQYYLMRARVRALTSRYPDEAIKYFKAQLNDNSYQHKTASQYGYALALMRNQNYNAAENAIKTLINSQPDQVIFNMALAEIYSEQQNYLAAIKLLARNYQLYPDYYPLQTQYATALLNNDNNKTALHLLQPLVFNHPHDLQINELLAQAQAKSGKLAQAYQTQAKIYLLIGEKQKALIQLEQALKQKNMDKNTREEIKNKIQELKLSS